MFRLFEYSDTYHNLICFYNFFSIWNSCISWKKFYENDRIIILSFDEWETDVLIPFVFELAGLSSFSPLFPLLGC